MLVAHFAVALAGAVLWDINTRSTREGATSSTTRGRDAGRRRRRNRRWPRGRRAKDRGEIITVVDPANPGDSTAAASGYETPVPAAGTTLPWEVADENSPIRHYTSGTTASPRGVQYSHRGGTYSSARGASGTPSTRTCDAALFHCNGWGNPVGDAIGAPKSAARGARRVIWRLIPRPGDPHQTAPTWSTTIRGPTRPRAGLQIPHHPRGATRRPRFWAWSDGRPVVHVYGITDTYGTSREPVPARMDAMEPRRRGPQARQAGMVCADWSAWRQQMNDVPPTARPWARS